MFNTIAIDGVFSIDGYLANLPEITALAERYDALLMVDDCHATGFMGPKGVGTAGHFGVNEKIDIVTGTQAFNVVPLPHDVVKLIGTQS